MSLLLGGDEAWSLRRYYVDFDLRTDGGRSKKSEGDSVIVDALSLLCSEVVVVVPMIYRFEICILESFLHFRLE